MNKRKESRMDTTNLEQISKELKNSSLENETTSVEGTNSLRSYIKDTLNALHNTRLKKKVFEVKIYLRSFAMPLRPSLKQCFCHVKFNRSLIEVNRM